MSRMDEMVDLVFGYDLSAEDRARAVRVVASAARDANDCRQLLDMLGLPAPTRVDRDHFPHLRASAE